MGTEFVCDGHGVLAHDSMKLDFQTQPLRWEYSNIFVLFKLRHLLTADAIVFQSQISTPHATHAI